MVGISVKLFMSGPYSRQLMSPALPAQQTSMRPSSCWARSAKLGRCVGLRAQQADMRSSQGCSQNMGMSGRSVPLCMHA